MKKLILILTIIVMMFSLVIVSYCAEKPEFYIRAATDSREDTASAMLVSRLKELVEERSNGRIEIDVFFDGILGSVREEIEGVQLGTIEITLVSNSPMTAWIPTMNLFELPFLFKDPEHLSAVVESDLVKEYAKDFSEKGFHLLGFSTFGLRHLMTTDKVVNSIADMKGLKIRTMENPIHLDSFKAFGASPLPMSYSELYTALETGVIDGAEAANSNYHSKKFYEPAPNWAMIGWINLMGVLIMNKDFYEKMPEDLQIIIDDAAKETCRIGRKQYGEVDEEKLVELKKLGINITYPDVAPFREASNQVYDKWASKVGGREKIDEILNFKY